MKNTKNIPSHIGVILDGNGRWATRRKLPRLVGHKKGVDAIERTIRLAKDFNIKYLSFFTFSTENWKRDKSEVDGIFDIVRDYLKSKVFDFKKEDIKIISMGDTTKIPADLQEELQNIIDSTKDCKSLIVNLAINYGGRDEITRAVNLLLKQNKKAITNKDIAENLYTKDLPDPDLIIRTSGEMRLSNFMLYQCAYSELYFAKVFWPSFNKRHFKKALNSFSKRDRRFGGIPKF